MCGRITHDLNIVNIVLEPTVKMGEFFVLQPNEAQVVAYQIKSFR